MYSRFTAVKKKRRHCKMSYVLLQLHSFLTSLSFQFILKCTTDCIFIELKLTRVCDWFIHPTTTLLCDPIYCGLLALSCVIQSTAALRFLVWSNLLLPSCTYLCDPIYCRLFVLSCVIQSTAAFLCVWSKPLPPSCTFLCDLLWSASVFLCAKIQHPWQGYVATMFWCAPKFSIHDEDMLQLCSRTPKLSIHEKDMLWLLFQCAENSASVRRTCCDYVRCVKIQHPWQRHLATMFQFRPILDEGPGSNFLGTNLDWFEANWILELDYTLVPAWFLVLQIRSSPFSTIFGSEPIDLPSKTGAM
jgi:hypothetical protein